MERKAYTAREVAGMLGISAEGVYRLVRMGRLSAIPIGSRRFVIPRSAVENFLAESGTVRLGKCATGGGE